MSNPSCIHIRDSEKTTELYKASVSRNCRTMSKPMFLQQVEQTLQLSVNKKVSTFKIQLCIFKTILELQVELLPNKQVLQD